MKRTPLKRKTRLRPRSPRRQKEEREYSRLRKQFLAEHPLCYVWWNENWVVGHGEEGRHTYEDACALVRLGCAKIPPEAFSDVVHHREKRGKNYLNTDTWLALSWKNHARVEGDSTYDGLPYGKSWARQQRYLANI